MVSVNAVLVAVFLSLVACARAKVTLRDLSGVWSGEGPATTANVLTPQGLDGLCLETLPQECREQIPPNSVTYTINGTFLTVETSFLPGINTTELSAALLPACAAAGIYPVAGASITPPSPIVKYSSKAGRIYYIDPRRPSEMNCDQVKYGVGADGAFLNVEFNLNYEGAPEGIVTAGPSFFCSSTPVECNVEFTAEGLARFSFELGVTLKCIDGDCLSAVGASPSPPSKRKESPCDD